MTTIARYENGCLARNVGIEENILSVRRIDAASVLPCRNAVWRPEGLSKAQEFVSLSENERRQKGCALITG